MSKLAAEVRKKGLPGIFTNQGTVRNPDRVKSIRINLRPSQLKKIDQYSNNRNKFIRSLVDQYFQYQDILIKNQLIAAKKAAHPTMVMDGGQAEEFNPAHPPGRIVHLKKGIETGAIVTWKHKTCKSYKDSTGISKINAIGKILEFKEKVLGGKRKTLCAYIDLCLNTDVPDDRDEYWRSLDKMKTWVAVDKLELKR